jgi:hypothetical protein
MSETLAKEVKLEDIRRVITTLQEFLTRVIAEGPVDSILEAIIHLEIAEKELLYQQYNEDREAQVCEDIVKDQASASMRAREGAS